jgi:hypothetical protein
MIITLAISQNSLEMKNLKIIEVMCKNLLSWRVNSLKITRKINLNHQIQQSHWPEKKKLEAYTQLYFAEH